MLFRATGRRPRILFPLFISQDRPDLLARKPAMLQEAALTRLFAIFGRSSRAVFLVPNTARQLVPVDIGLFEMGGDQLTRDTALFQFTANPDRPLPFAYTVGNKSRREPIVADETILNQYINGGVDRVRVELPRDEFRAQLGDRMFSPRQEIQRFVTGGNGV